VVVGTKSRSSRFDVVTMLGVAHLRFSGVSGLTTLVITKTRKTKPRHSVDYILFCDSIYIDFSPTICSETSRAILDRDGYVVSNWI
jgi:hypothetical protein